jgi:hypothetical protein
VLTVTASNPLLLLLLPLPLHPQNYPQQPVMSWQRKHRFLMQLLLMQQHTAHVMLFQ